MDHVGDVQDGRQKDSLYSSPLHGRLASKGSPGPVYCRGRSHAGPGAHKGCLCGQGIRSLRSLGPLFASFLRIRHTDLFEPSDRGGHLRFRGLPLHRGGSHPDHDAIATFGKRPLGETDAFFVQILQIAHQMGSRKVGTVSRDGTKVKANASKHRALSHRHAGKLRKQLEPEVRDSDQVNLTDEESRIMLT